MKKLLTVLLLAASLVGTAQAQDFTLTVLHTDHLHGHVEPVKVSEHFYDGYVR